MKDSGSKPIAVFVVGILGIFAIAGLWMTYDLIKADRPGELIAVISGLTGTGLGFVGGVISKTEKK